MERVGHPIAVSSWIWGPSTVFRNSLEGRSSVVLGANRLARSPIIFPGLRRHHVSAGTSSAGRESASALAMGFVSSSILHTPKHARLTPSPSRRCWLHTCGLRLLSLVDGSRTRMRAARSVRSALRRLSQVHGRLAGSGRTACHLWHLPLCESGLRPAISMAGCTAAEPCREPQVCLRH